MTVRLKILRGPRAGQEYEFDDDEITIGSARSNKIVILDNDVSPYHCRLLRVQQDYDIEDLNSRYGTFVNGQRITASAFTLPGNAIIELGGQVTIEYHLKQKETPNTERLPIYMVEGDPGSQPVLVQLEDGTITDAFLLQSETISLGRSTDNDIIIQQIDISRKHVTFTWQNGRYYIEDLSSRNGTFVNGERLKGRLELHHSDVIQLGASVRLHLIFRADLPPDMDKRIQLSGASAEDPRDKETTDYTIPMPTTTKRGTSELPMIMQDGEMHDYIFMVYARDDWEGMVATLVMNLNDSKQQVWVDQPLTPNSEVWRAAVAQAQRECWLLIVVMSPAALRSNYVQDQYRYFYNREKPILLIEYQDVEKLPLQLARVPRITYDPEQPGKMFQRLLYEIMTLKPRNSKRDEA